MARGGARVGQYAVGDAIDISVASAGEQANEPPKVIQLFKMGAHPTRNGKPKVVRVDSLAHAEQIVATASAYHRDNEMVVDFDHQTVHAARTGTRAEAAGWSPRLFATEQGVFAEVDWNDDARIAIQAKRYRYISPVFTHDAQGRVICPINAALTNTPSLDLVALATALSTAEGTDSMNYGPIAKALGLGEDASEEEILRAIANHTAAATMTAIASALGVAEDADLIAAATALKGKADNAGNPDPTKFVPMDTVTELQTSVQSLQGDLDGMKAKERQRLIDEAQRKGRLTPAMAKHAATIGDDVALASFLGSLPESGLGKAAIEGDPDADKSKLSEDDLAVCSAMGLSQKDFLAAREKEGAN